MMNLYLPTTSPTTTPTNFTSLYNFCLALSLEFCVTCKHSFDWLFLTRHPCDLIIHAFSILKIAIHVLIINKCASFVFVLQKK